MAWLYWYDYYSNGADSYLWSMICLFCAYLIISVFAMVYALLKLRKSTISKEIVSIIFKRHFLALAVKMLCDAYWYIGYVIMLLHPESYSPLSGYIRIYRDDPPFAISFFKIICLLGGFLLPLSRLSEPVFFQTKLAS